MNYTKMNYTNYGGVARNLGLAGTNSTYHVSIVTSKISMKSL